MPQRTSAGIAASFRDYLRSNKLSSLVWNSYEEMLEACKTAWLFPGNDPARIVSIGTRQWAWVKG